MTDLRDYDTAIAVIAMAGIRKRRFFLRHAILSVCHQRHIGRVLRSPCNEQSPASDFRNSLVGGPCKRKGRRGSPNRAGPRMGRNALVHRLTAERNRDGEETSPPQPPLRLRTG